MMDNHSDELSGLGFAQLKSTECGNEEKPKWYDVALHLASADGRLPTNVRKMQWRVVSWPLLSPQKPKRVWHHLIERVRGGGVA